MTDGATVGLIGLGTMGAMLAMNIADHGFRIAVYNRTTAKTQQFADSAGTLADRIVPCATLDDLIEALPAPRRIILMVPAGPAVDEQIAALRPLLGSDDLIIDAGNSDYRDTERRADEARSAGVPFLGMGVSGGAKGARFGPSIMAGGDAAAWDRASDVLLTISAKYKGRPCAGCVGPGGAGHFVKTVHNGIEYGDMQIIAEAYGILRDGLGLDPGRIGQIFRGWNDGPLQSYLIEITSQIGAAKDADTGQPMLQVIADRAGQKGTGRWTVIEAQQEAVPIPVIEAAVAARNLSARGAARHAGQDRFAAAPAPMAQDVITLDQLESALIAAKILCYAQGFDLIASSSERNDWAVDLAQVAELWREGCIIRSAMLDDMATAFRDSGSGSLMLAPRFADLLAHHVPDLRAVVIAGLAHGQGVAALSAALSYFDVMRTARSTANMIQAQRDFFGAHGFERVDRDGSDFHGPWAMDG